MSGLVDCEIQACDVDSGGKQGRGPLDGDSSYHSGILSGHSEIAARDLVVTALASDTFLRVTAELSKARKMRRTSISSQPSAKYTGLFTIQVIYGELLFRFTKSVVMNC